MTANDPESPFPLLRLPSEIRYQIFCHNLYTPRRITLKRKQPESYTAYHTPWRPDRPGGVNFSLFYVSRTVSKEAIRAFYSVNAFNINKPLIHDREFDVFYTSRSQSILRNTLGNQTQFYFSANLASLIKDLQISRSFLYPYTEFETPVQRLNNLLTLCNLRKLQISFERSFDQNDIDVKRFLIQLLLILVTSRHHKRANQRSRGVDVIDPWPNITGRLSLPSVIGRNLRPVTELSFLAQHFTNDKIHGMLKQDDCVRFGSLREVHIYSGLVPDEWELALSDLNQQNPWKELGAFKTWEDRLEDTDVLGSLHLKFMWKGNDEQVGAPD